MTLYFISLKGQNNMTNATYVTVERNILEVNFADTSFETLSRKRTFTDTDDVMSYLSKKGILVDENNVNFL